MIITTIMGILAVFFAYLVNKNVKNGLRISFSIIFIFLGLRYNFGNDYQAYLNSFIGINSYNRIDFFDETVRLEPGWVFLCRLFKPLGFFIFVIALALINCIIYYHFIKKYVPVKYYWLAVFLYIFNPEFMLVHTSAMRQSVSIGLFIFSLDYLFKKDAIRYFLCVGIAWLFHSSSLILIPVFFLRLLKWKINKAYIPIYISILILLFIFGNFFQLYLNQFVNNYFLQYEIYHDIGGSGIGTGLGLLYLSIPFTLLLYYESFQKKEISLLFKISIFSFVFVPLSLMLLIITRIGMFFLPSTIIAYPIIQSSLKKPNSKTIFFVSLIFMTLYNYFQFFQSATYKTHFATYQTVFSAPNWY